MKIEYDEHGWAKGFKNVHDPDDCIGQLCDFHGRLGPEPWASWPRCWRADLGQVEMIDPRSGIGHPSPAQAHYLVRSRGPIASEAYLTHGCDGGCYGAYSHLSRPVGKVLPESPKENRLTFKNYVTIQEKAKAIYWDPEHAEPTGHEIAEHCGSWLNRGYRDAEDGGGQEPHWWVPLPEPDGTFQGREAHPGEYVLVWRDSYVSMPRERFERQFQVVA